MTPEAWMHLLNYTIIVLVVSILYCIGLIIFRAVKLTKNLERREREFLNGAYFQLKLKEHNANLSSDIPIRYDDVDTESLRPDR